MEKVYNTMKSIGCVNLVLGICSIVIGIGLGIGMIINGAILLKRKSQILF